MNAVDTKNVPANELCGDLTTISSMKYSKQLIFILYGIVVIEYICMLASSGKISMGGSTYILALIEYISLFILLKIAMGAKLGDKIPLTIKVGYLLWLAINLMNFLRGLILASGYWDYKTLLLTSFSFSVIALVFYVGVNLRYFVVLYREFFFKIIWLALILTPFLYYYTHECFSRIAIPITFFLCVLPWVNNRTKIVIITLAATSVFIALDFRTNIIKTALALGVLVLYWISKRTTPLLFNLVHKVFFIIPIILLFLGLTGRFNIFSYASQQNIGTVTDSNGHQVSMSGDTRTFLYREVISSVMATNNWLLGESSSGSYRSIFFINTGGAMNGKRYASEVGILNIFLYYGVLGVGAYFFLLYIVSSIAISKSNNHLSKMFGLLIASRWALSFIEEFTRFDMNFFFFWLIMGLVSTESFRSLSNMEVAQFFQAGHKMPRSYYRFRARLVGR